MAISRVASSFGSTAGTSISFGGSYQAGDTAFVVAYNNATGTVPSLPGGWSSVTSVSSGGQALNVGYKILPTGSGETSGTWTNATEMMYVIYRGLAATPFSNAGGQTGSSNQVAYSGIVTFGNPSVDWVMLVAVSTSNSGNLASHPPTSSTLVTGDAPSYEVALFDTNGPVASYSFNQKTLDGSVAWMTKTIELVAEVVSSSRASTRMMMGM